MSGTLGDRDTGCSHFWKLTPPLDTGTGGPTVESPLWPASSRTCPTGQHVSTSPGTPQARQAGGQRHSPAQQQTGCLNTHPKPTAAPDTALPSEGPRTWPHTPGHRRSGTRTGTPRALQPETPGPAAPTSRQAPAPTSRTLLPSEPAQDLGLSSPTGKLTSTTEPPRPPTNRLAHASRHQEPHSRLGQEPAPPTSGLTPAPGPWGLLDLNSTLQGASTSRGPPQGSTVAL